MRTQQFAVLTRRRFAGVTMLIGALVALAMFASSVDAQDQPPAPQVFWGADADAYAGSEVKVFDQNGAEISAGGEGTGTIDSEGTWFVQLSEDDAERVKLRIVSASGDRETGLLDVIGFDFKEISIRAFSPVSDELAGAGDTLTVQIRARVYPSSEDPTIPFRSIEFNLSVDGQPEQLNDNPRERTIRPNHAGGRWYRSNWFDLDDGFRAAIIACKDPSGGVRFGIRVDGRDDIIPRLNLLPGSRTSTRWAASNEVEISRTGDDANPSRAGRGDTNCRFGKDN
ncbi:MAG: hypothetical protein OXS30_12155 [Chloroflexota bacterium]|nr:hypothetical protein [Chloroflexota bacterium]